MKAIAADPMDPAILRKSVKFGIRRAIPVMSHTIADRTPTFFSFLESFVPFLKN
jgi:hypothetical protein